MYYHPMAWPWIGSADRNLSAQIEASLDAAIDGIAAQQRLHMEVMKALLLAPLRLAAGCVEPSEESPCTEC